MNDVYYTGRPLLGGLLFGMALRCEILTRKKFIILSNFYPYFTEIVL